MLTFSTTTWNMAQTVKVTHAVEDASSWTEFCPADDAAGLAVSPRAVTATGVADDVDRADAQVTVSATSLTIQEDPIGWRTGAWGRTRWC